VVEKPGSKLLARRRAQDPDVEQTVGRRWLTVPRLATLLLAVIVVAVVSDQAFGASGPLGGSSLAAQSGRNLGERFLNVVVDGLVAGLITSLTSVGLSLIFGVTGLVNFAHGELVTFGAVVAWFFNAGNWGFQVTLAVAALIAVVAGGLLGAGLEKGVFGPLRRRKVPNISLIVTTIGLSLVVRHVILIWYGSQTQKYRDYATQVAKNYGPVSITDVKLAIIVISALVLALVGLLLMKTKLGTAMRAVADNRDLAAASGIDVRKVILATWIGGAALAALGGVFQGIGFAGVSWDLGFKLLLLMFAAVILGGLGTAFGAMVGGVLIGVVTQVSSLWLSTEFKLVIAFGILIVVLLVRPQGILGKKERVG
jgi:branched-chain amino acid transport system permease protein